MNAKAIVTGLWGLLVFATPALADPLLASTAKAYRLLQTISSQLQEVQTNVASSGATPAAALAKAQEQVRIAAAHVCHSLYAAQLTAAKAALMQGKQQQALHHLSEADKTLGKCAASPRGEEPEGDAEALALGGAFELR